MSCRATKSGSSSARSCEGDRKSTRLNSSHDQISYAVFCLKKKKKKYKIDVIDIQIPQTQLLRDLIDFSVNRAKKRVQCNITIRLESQTREGVDSMLQTSTS